MLKECPNVIYKKGKNTYDNTQPPESRWTSRANTACWETCPLNGKPVEGSGNDTRSALKARSLKANAKMILSCQFISKSG